jgi:hypothetical protein
MREAALKNRNEMQQDFENKARQTQQDFDDNTRRAKDAADSHTTHLAEMAFKEIGLAAMRTQQTESKEHSLHVKEAAESQGAAESCQEAVDFHREQMEEAAKFHCDQIEEAAQSYSRRTKQQAQRKLNVLVADDAAQDEAQEVAFQVQRVVFEAQEEARRVAYKAQRNAFKVQVEAQRAGFEAHRVARQAQMKALQEELMGATL